MRASFGRLTALLLAAALFVAGALPVPAQAADDGELTLQGVVDDAIIGHAANGYYLDFKPFGTLELPRIFLARTADGALTLDAYGSTKGALKSGAYGLVPHAESEGEGGEASHGEAGHGELITEGQALEEALAANGLEVADVDLVIPHQANLRITKGLEKHLPLSEEGKVVHTIQRYGNLSGSTVAVTLDEVLRGEHGPLPDPTRVVLTAVGGGYTSAGAVLACRPG